MKITGRVMDWLSPTAMYFLGVALLIRGLCLVVAVTDGIPGYTGMSGASGSFLGLLGTILILRALRKGNSKRKPKLSAKDQLVHDAVAEYERSKDNESPDVVKDRAQALERGVRRIEQHRNKEDGPMVG